MHALDVLEAVSKYVRHSSVSKYELNCHYVILEYLLVTLKMKRHNFINENHKKNIYVTRRETTNCQCNRISTRNGDNSSGTATMVPRRKPMVPR